MHMLRSGDLNPHLFVYPTLFMYVLLAVYCFTFFRGVSGGLWAAPAQIQPPLFILGGRITAAGFGAGTLLAVHAAGKRLLDAPSAALAALALAVMPLHVADSHFVATDVPAGFFSAALLCAAAALADEGGKRQYMLVGLLAGLAAATKYNAGLVVINLPLAHWLNARRERFFDANLARGLLWVVVGFLIACPYALLDLPNFLDGVATEIAHYSRAHVGHEGRHNLVFYFLFLAGRGFGPVLTGLGIYGLCHLLRHFRRRDLLLLVFPAAYMLLLASYKVRFVRNLMPVLPYFALWVGLGASRAFREARDAWPALARVSAWKLALPLLALSLIWPLAISLDETRALAAPDTRLTARDWVQRHVPAGSTIYLQAWSVDALPPKKYRLSSDRFSWDYYVATDRLTRKYFDMAAVNPEKYKEVKEAFQHRPVAFFPGRSENPFYCTASPSVAIFARDPARPAVRAPAP
jgi:hypothetical protein